MKVVHGKATISDGGILTMALGEPVRAGEHDVSVVLHDADAQPVPPFHLPTVEIDEWPPALSLRREDLYGEWGR